MSYSRSYYDIDKLHPFDLTGILVYEDVFNGVLDNFELPGGRTVPYEVIDLVQGDNRTVKVYVKDRNMDIVNLAGATAWFAARMTADGSNVIQKSTANPSQGQIGAADEGEILFYIVPSDTNQLAIRQYLWYVNVMLQNGKSYTVVNGVLNLLSVVG